MLSRFKVFLLLSLMGPYFIFSLAVLAMAYGFLYFSWNLIKYFYEVTTGYSGIHYVIHRPAEIKMNTRVSNSLSCEVDFVNSSLTEVKCTLRCDGMCYVQAMWGVPIYELVGYLNKMTNSWPFCWKLMRSPHPTGEMGIKVVYGGTPELLTAGRDVELNFRMPSSYVPSLQPLLRNDHSRTIYPFVLLMVVYKNDTVNFPEPFVVASAYAVHLPDEVLNKSFLITQLVRLSSYEVGQVKKVFRASADERSDLCLICYQQPATIVQLSCLHFCLCRTCYEKCDKCPVCRNSRMEFFELPSN